MMLCVDVEDAVNGLVTNGEKPPLCLCSFIVPEGTCDMHAPTAVMSSR